MSILIFVAAVAGALVLDRQEARHRYEKRKEYERLGWEIPVPKPKLTVLESWGNIMIGAILIAVGGLLLMAMLQLPGELGTESMETSIALYLASGLALVGLGVKAIRQNARHNASQTQSAATTKS